MLIAIILITHTALSEYPKKVFAYVSELYDFTFSDTITQNDLVLVEFYSPSCPHCQSIVSDYEGLSITYGDIVSFARIDAEVYAAIRDYYNVDSWPTFILFADGEPIERLTGADKIDQLDTILSYIYETVNQPTSWSLQVRVYDIPFDVSNVIVTVKTPFQEQTSKSFYASSQNMQVTFDIPYSKIPSGYYFDVCIREDGDLFDWCQSVYYNGIPSAYTIINWPTLQTSQFGDNENNDDTGACPASFENTQMTQDDFGRDQNGFQECKLPGDSSNPLLPF